MQTVYKYPIPIQDTFTLDLPVNSEVLYIGIQNQEPFMWVGLMTELRIEKVTFHVLGTGQSMGLYPERYIGSFILLKDEFVGHVFQEA